VCVYRERERDMGSIFVIVVLPEETRRRWEKKDNARE
jgi:hypothetical protein